MNHKVKTCVLIAMALSLIFCGWSWADESDLIWSTYLGAGAKDVGYDIAVDGSGNVYIAGRTFSANFPTTAGAFDTTLSSSFDIFATKLNPTGSTLDFSTFLGGNSDDWSEDIIVDGSGNVFITGSTESPDFPTTPAAFDTTHNGISEAYVVKFDPTGSALVYATFLGGSAGQGSRGMALDDLGNAYVTGQTSSSDFPTTDGAFDTSYNGGLQDAFVAKLNPTGSALVYATFLGGSDRESGWEIAIDGSGNAYMYGKTRSSDFPTTSGAFDTTYNGDFDPVVAKLNPTGSALEYSTFLGGSGVEHNSYGIAVDGSDNVYVTGGTNSSDFPTTTGAFDTTYNSGLDVFVAKLNPAGSALDYSTFLGGSGEELGRGLAVDGAGNAYVGGHTKSSNFPTTAGAFDTTYNGGNGDVFVVKLNSTGSALSYATFFGGSSSDGGYGITIDNSGCAYVTGYTESSNFPTTGGVFDESYNGSDDAFVAKLDLWTPPPFGCLSGTVSDSLNGLLGVNLDVYDSTGTLWRSLVTDDSGYFSADSIPNGDYSATVITPLGYYTDQETKEFTILGDSVTVDFHLTKLEITPQQRTRGYWAQQLNKALRDRPRDYAREEFAEFAYQIALHFNNNLINPVIIYDVPAGATVDDSLDVLKRLLTFRETEEGEPFLRRIAKGQVVALMLNVVSGKISQTEAITEDGMNVSQAITYCDMLIYDLVISTGDVPDWFMPFYERYEEVLRYLKASFIAGRINVGVTLQEGTIPPDVANIAYKYLTSPVPQFRMHQNYPNPFNPATEISYAVPRDVHVTVKIYNVQGAEVTTLVDEDQSAGVYTLRWNAKELGSGVYFCRLQAGGFEKTVKMMLIK